MTFPNEVPVAVVGAGPVGLTMAAELARHGVPCRIFDQEPAPRSGSRAVAIQARTLEIFDDLGIVDRVLQAGQKIHGVNVFAEGHRILQFTFDELASPFPFAVDLPQHVTERILEEHLRCLGIEVERPRTVTGVNQDASGVTLYVQTPTGPIANVRAQFVIGCDGAHSTVRHVTSIPYESVSIDEGYIAADLPLRWDGGDDEWSFWMHEDGLFGLFPLGNGRYRAVAAAPSEFKADRQTLQQVFERRGPGNIALGEPEFIGAYRLSHRRASAYRHARVFVAGDAAHVQTPAGSQGMNAGIQDAYNLAWKIGMHYRGNAPDALLDSYNAEREPVAREVLSLSESLSAIAAFRRPVSQGIRNRLLPFLAGFEVFEQRLVNRLAEISVNYRRSPAVSQCGHWYAGPRPGDRAVDAPLGEGRRLFELLRGTRHVVLLFGAEHRTEEDTRNFESIARYMNDGYPSETETHLIAHAPLDWHGSSVLDRSGAAHHAYGAGVPCVYLIRPDGYVGFRSLSPDPLPLLEHMNRVYEP